MSIRHMLFDLDGTLLPMVQNEFVRFYMPLLAKSYIQAGVEVDPKGFIGAVWKGYEAMVKNDGTRTNREAFWSYMEDILPASTEESETLAVRFYEGDFNQAKCGSQTDPQRKTDGNHKTDMIKYQRRNRRKFCIRRRFARYARQAAAMLA